MSLERNYFKPEEGILMREVASWPTSFKPDVVGSSLGSGALSSYCISLEAWRRGLTVVFESDDLRYFSVSNGDHTVDFDFARPRSITTDSVRGILNSKWDTTSRLRESGVRVPAGVLLNADKLRHEDIIAAGESIGYPIVLKPNVGSSGNGVMTGIRSPGELTESFDYVAEKFSPKQVVIEEHLAGDDYRVLVVGDRVVGAVRRDPASVVGDGRSSIIQLIDAKNLERRKNPFLSTGLIKFDFEIHKCLSELKLTAESVPRKDEKIFLRRIANASAGGDTVDVTDILPEEILVAAVRAVNSIPGLVVAGVDVLYKTGCPASSENYAIIEINPRPHIGVNMYPSVGCGRDVPRAILDCLFPKTDCSQASELARLRFDVDAVASVLRGGFAAHVRLSACPRTPPGYRRSFRCFSENRSLSQRRLPHRTIQKLALSLSVSGRVRRLDDDKIELIVFSRDSRVGNRFLEEVLKLLSVSVVSRSVWRGPVTTGFKVIQ